MSEKIITKIEIIIVKKAIIKKITINSFVYEKKLRYKIYLSFFSYFMQFPLLLLELSVSF